MTLRERFYELAAKASRRAPETGPVAVTGRRVYILPTGGGLFFAFVVAAILLGSLNYQSSLGFLFTFLLASLGLVSMVATQRNLLELTVTVGEPAPVFAGEAPQIPLIVSCARGGSRFGLAAFASGGEPAAFHLRGGPARIVLPGKPRLRGVEQVGRITLESIHPLGLFRAWSPLESGVGAVVYPRPVDSPFPAPGGGEAGGEAAGRDDGAGGGSEEFRGLRDYLPTDPPARVHWKSFARTGTLAVKEFDSEGGRSLVLDYGALGGEDPEARLSLLCGWLLRARAEGLPWSLLLPGESPLSGSGAEAFRLALEALARFRP